MSPVAQPPQYLIDTRVGVERPAAQSSSLISSVSERSRFEIQVTQPAADWVRAALDRIQDLTTLAPGWDGYAARAIDATVAVEAVRWVLDHAYPTVPQPAIVPSADGGIQIEWHRGGVDFEVAINEVESTVYLEDHETADIQERPAEEATAIFSSVLGRLASA
jgi:hypothetical protein